MYAAKIICQAENHYQTPLSQRPGAKWPFSFRFRADTPPRKSKNLPYMTYFLLDRFHCHSIPVSGVHRGNETGGTRNSQSNSYFYEI